MAYRRVYDRSEWGRWRPRWQVVKLVKGTLRATDPGGSLTGLSVPEPARQPDEPPQRSVAEVVNGRLPNGQFAPGNQAAVGHGLHWPTRKIVRAILLHALSAEQPRGRGKSKQVVKAAATLDSVEGVQLILRRKKVPNAKVFLAVLELIRDVLDDDSQAGAQARQTLFVLSGDYHDVKHDELAARVSLLECQLPIRALRADS